MVMIQPLAAPSSCGERPISYKNANRHNSRTNKGFYADFFRSEASRKSTLFGLAPEITSPRSIASLFSIIQRAIIAAAACSIHESSSALRVFERFAQRLREASSKSCNDRSDASSKKSNEGMGIGSLLDVQKHYVHTYCMAFTSAALSYHITDAAINRSVIDGAKGGIRVAV